MNLAREVDKMMEEREDVWPLPLPLPTSPNKVEQEPWPSWATRRFLRNWPQSFFDGNRAVHKGNDETLA